MSPDEGVVLRYVLSVHVIVNLLEPVYDEWTSNIYNEPSVSVDYV